MNRPIRHDVLLAWRETAAALAGWGDRALVLIGMALIVASMRHAAAIATTTAIAGTALLAGAWIGFGLGRMIEQRIVFHASDYLYAADILRRAGTRRYRDGTFLAVLVSIIAIAAVIELRAILPAVAGYVVGLGIALAWGRRAAAAPEWSAGGGRRARVAMGVSIGVVLATLRWWWPMAPAWSAAPLIGAAIAIMAPYDAEAIRFDAVIGRTVGATVGRLGAAVLWLVGLTVIVVIAHGPSAAMIGAAIGAVLIWLTLLRVLAWRMVGRRSGDLIALAMVAMSAVAGAMAIPLAPIALAAATIWLWRRAQAARWLIA